MDTFTLSAPLAPPENAVLLTFYENLVAALGKMSGGMLGSGHALDIADDSMSLMCLQAIASEAGMPHILMGVSPSIDMDCAYMAMADGTIWKFEAMTVDTHLVSVISRADAEDCTKHCAACMPYAEAIKIAAVSCVMSTGNVDAKDTVTGTVSTDVHAAICHRLKGTGKLIVRGEGGFIKDAYEFRVDAPPRVDLDEVEKIIELRKMTIEEIRSEQKSYNNLLGVESPFNVKVGQA